MGTISVTNLGKAYKKYPTRWARLAEWILPFSKTRHTQTWVLKDINFTVKPGEALGIIGVNGAGKSTLLKMITGTAQPTTGSVHMTGRIAAMLELGMGFHPDFTGRQNAYMAGQLLGYSADEITKLLPDIEAFAEIGDYIDQAVRVYSSGMQMRLAFSVATAIRPDILIVDEALSVGDAYFVHKSFARIRQFRELGTTLLIVSHDKGAIQAICDHAILLADGTVAMEGEPEEVMDYYNAILANHQAQDVKQVKQIDGKTQTSSGTGEVTVTDITLLDQDGNRIEHVSAGQTVVLSITAKAHKFIERLVLGYGIKDRLGQLIFGTNTHHMDQAISNVAAGSEVSFKINFLANLGVGTYSIQTALVSTDTHMENNYEWRDRSLIFNVINTTKPSFVGVSWLDHRVEISVANRPHLLKK